MTKIAVFDSALSIIYKDQLNTGNENFFKAEFTFNETWEGFEKHAVFYQVLTQTPFEADIDPETNTVEIPNELLVIDLPLFIGAYGIKDGVIISTNFKSIPVSHGAFSESLASFNNVKAEIVRSTDTRIKFIRVNENGEFQYSIDGQTWNLVTQTVDYSEIYQKIDAVEKHIAEVEKSIPKPLVSVDSRIKIIGQTISLDGVEKRYIRLFNKNDFIYNSSQKYYTFTIPKKNYALENAYVVKVTVDRAVKTNGTVVVAEETEIMSTDTIDSNGNIVLIVDIDLSTYSEYSGKIIIKGD